MASQEQLNRPEEEVSETLTRYFNTTGHWVVYCALALHPVRISPSCSYMLIL
jgi:hypothetical protein